MANRSYLGFTAILSSIATMLVLSSSAYALTDCSFTTVGTTMTLDGDCTTDSTISVPDGYTLNGHGYAITAVDPAAGHFVGAVVANSGNEAHVTNLTVTANSLSNTCDGGDNRLRGIMLEGAEGSITNNTVVDINQGPSGCQEGNGIEVRNSPFDGSHPDTKSVLVKGNYLDDWQKTGIVANGDVDVEVKDNFVGNSISDMYGLAGNSIQLGFGATGTVSNNVVEGNQWCGGYWAATAMLIYLADNVQVINNVVTGNSDIGIYVFGDNAIVRNNKVFDDKHIEDCGDYDIGIGNWGTDGDLKNNKVRGFDISYDPFKGKNKVIPGPNGNASE